jgi:hypothetical protein
MIDKLSGQITYAVLTTDFVAIHGDERLLQNSVVFSDGIDPSVLAQRCAILNTRGGVVVGRRGKT